MRVILVVALVLAGCSSPPADAVLPPDDPAGMHVRAINRGIHPVSFLFEATQDNATVHVERESVQPGGSATFVWQAEPSYLGFTVGVEGASRLVGADPGSSTGASYAATQCEGPSWLHAIVEADSDTGGSGISGSYEVCQLRP